MSWGASSPSAEKNGYDAQVAPLSTSYKARVEWPVGTKYQLNLLKSLALYGLLHALDV